MDAFDFFDMPLTGNRLIEASAGTGKTYTIAGLFIRLLLEQELTVEQILVVTYTKAATEELKTRIRRRIADARDGFVSGRAADDLIAGLLAKTSDHRRAAHLLGDALADFDRASIFTIHGFCQRILHENAFETGIPYDTELITDPRDLCREIAEDFWRIHFYAAPAEWVSYAARSGVRDPFYFEQLAASVHFLEATVIPQLPPPELNALEGFRRQFRQLATRWPDARDAALGLLRSPALDGRAYGSLQTGGRTGTREIRLAGLAAEMDRFVGSQRPDFPPFTALERFTTSGLQRFVRKGHRPPQHELFDMCDQLQRRAQALEAEMQQLMLHLKTEYFRWAQIESERRKKARNIQHYEDLLLAVKKALATSPGDKLDLLVPKIQKKFRAALVDEFQDTDAVQYEIFSTVFGSDRNLLCIIGDPKQSIYSFRGADIFSYMAASAGADSRYTLQENWRSDAGLITAVNTMFAGTRAPFLFEAITCEPTRPGNRTDRDPTTGTLPSLVLWYLPSQGGKPVNKIDAVALISEAVGDQIARLINAVDEPVAPADIAVLVRTNRQAQIIKESLVKRDIPAVLYSSGSVFATGESRELLRVLTGIMEHGNESRFRSALATELLGVSGDALARVADQPAQWEARRRRFREYADAWKRLGFIRMFRSLLAREKVRGRLLAFADGERRLTNLLHLAEVLHREDDRRQLAPPALLKWLADRCRPDQPAEDEHQLRLESDERAVKLVTVHKSKGLEYPVVFCPFGWERSTLRADEQVVFHSSDPTGRLTVDLGSDRLDAHRILAQHENLAENLRLLYVAVTRAKKHCYLVWGRIRSAETSALAYLLHLADTAGDADVLAAMQQRFAAFDDVDLLADLHGLAERSKGAISVEMLPDRLETSSRPPRSEAKTLVCPPFSGRIETFWKIASFSAMISRQPQEAGLPDHDVDLQLPTASPGEPLEEARQADERRTIFDFPRGAKAGIFFHDLLEHLDFTPASEPDRSGLISAKLKQYGYDPGWHGTLKQTLDHLLQVQLPAMPAGSERFSLSALTAMQRANEMEFTFPLKPISPEALANIFSRHGGPQLPAGAPRRLQNLSFSPAGGFLMGYVDMLFCRGDRYYLLDWKSNYLGNRREDYNADRLAEIMVSEQYILQYCLYTVATNRYLQLHRPDYSYEGNFGGVFYVFIRAADADGDPGYGIYHDRPNFGLIRALDEALIDL